MKKKWTSVYSGLLGFVIIAGGAGLVDAKAEASSKETQINVTIINTKGEQIGNATLTQKPGAVRIHLEAKNLPPGVHGIHFHEVGKCDPPSFESAGAHLNPFHKQHGFNNPKGFHSGDLLNIEVAKDGTVNTDLESKTVTLERGMPNSLLHSGGTSLMIHEKADDYVTDPSGNSGARIACGPIL
ncbi:superoxide dismutase family protein [Cohnella terricola]|uniref:Superoxide dismutase [Cu-Zn] n=1 Tax=Cohnella terricola TaxID=1289167 RepID=A0A559JQ28_9BACL|nr:superoxide dismutase family protein [Cohnella terricola]TVY01982.1 superoxide dismutase family protein [Cohnella terricola]